MDLFTFEKRTLSLHWSFSTFAYEEYPLPDIWIFRTRCKVDAFWTSPLHAGATAWKLVFVFAGEPYDTYLPSVCYTIYVQVQLPLLYLKGTDLTHVRREKYDMSKRC